MEDDFAWSSSTRVPSGDDLPPDLPYEDLLCLGTTEALRVVYRIMKTGDDRERLKAATAWLDRAKGKPQQELSVRSTLTITLGKILDELDGMSSGLPTMIERRTADIELEVLED